MGLPTRTQVRHWQQRRQWERQERIRLERMCRMARVNVVDVRVRACVRAEPHHASCHQSCPPRETNGPTRSTRHSPLGVDLTHVPMRTRPARAHTSDNDAAE
eukprot:2425613-Pleurochrysis_carterae.AAC.1